METASPLLDACRSLGTSWGYIGAMEKTKETARYFGAYGFSGLNIITPTENEPEKHMGAELELVGALKWCRST